MKTGEGSAVFLGEASRREHLCGAGAADAGRDILLEYEPDVYELLDLERPVPVRGRARKLYDAPGQDPPGGDQIPHITAEYYTAKSRDIDIIKLNGSIELALPSWACPT